MVSVHGPVLDARGQDRGADGSGCVLLRVDRALGLGGMWGWGLHPAGGGRAQP